MPSKVTNFTYLSKDLVFTIVRSSKTDLSKSIPDEVLNQVVCWCL